MIAPLGVIASGCDKKKQVRDEFECTMLLCNYGGRQQSSRKIARVGTPRQGTTPGGT